MKTFWLSFCDNEKPEGQQFSGVCVVDVPDDLAAVTKMMLITTHPHHQSGAEWTAAAIRLAWLHGCNPGGQVKSIELVPRTDAERAIVAQMPRNVLMSKTKLRVLGLI